VKLLYFDCPSGISGDMTLAALLEVGADPALLPATVAALGLESEVEIDIRHEQRGHLGGCRVVVECRPGPSRTVPQLQETVVHAHLPEQVRDRALDAILRLGQAEARVHRQPLEALHLHELGGADTLIDLVGSFWLLESLQVEAVYASPLPAPQTPHSAPATLRLLESSGALLTPDPRHVELVTPTGAAILAAVAVFKRPALKLIRAGYGLGSRPDPNNAVCAWFGEAEPEVGRVVVLETNVDDMPANQLAALAEDLLGAGALDFLITPVLMKKGRPGHLLTVLAEPGDETRLGQSLLQASTTLGVRIARAERLLAGRRLMEVETPVGRVKVKVKELAGKPVDVAPEYEDCRRLGDVREVARLATEAARRQLKLK
jgi:pyridinium-3,5-bisthiocarboxylic acid mononucleotide nickel chelatase